MLIPRLMRREIRLTIVLYTQFSVIIGLIKQSGGPNTRPSCCCQLIIAARVKLIYLCLQPSITASRGKWTRWKGQFVRFQRFHVKLPWRLQVITERTKRRRLLFPSKLALSETDKMKPDWTRSNRGSCKEEALWLILCSFNKLSPKGRHLGSKQAALTVFSSPLLLVHPTPARSGTCGILSRCL